MNTTTIVVFGASGDLTERKLIPALYNNFCKGRLPENTRIIGMARSPFTDESFVEKMHNGMKKFAKRDLDDASWREFSQRLHYQPGDLTQMEAYIALEKKINTFSDKGGNRLYYLATAPQYYPIAVLMLGKNNMAFETGRTGYRRIIVEKPFGRNLVSANKLNKEIHKVFHENQVYRIDHYLGKETVQNILVFRFGNAIFEPVWNRNYVDNVQITVSESVGVGHRAEYYDSSGVLRDMFQNHLLQLLTLVSMEPPVVYDADALRNKKVEVLSAIRPMSNEDIAKYTIRAQYKGYLNEPNIKKYSKTSTYAALQLFIDNWRWQGVPFYLRSGKMMAEKSSEITIEFRCPPHQLFSTEALSCELFSNRLSICIEPDEGLHLRFSSKVPDQGMQMRPVDMDFLYKDSYEDNTIPEAYERLLMDALNGDATLFARSDEIELAWKLIDSIHDGWKSNKAPPIVSYEQGSWGPKSADKMVERNGHIWAHSCGVHNS